VIGLDRPRQLGRDEPPAEINRPDEARSLKRRSTTAGPNWPRRAAGRNERTILDRLDSLSDVRGTPSLMLLAIFKEIETKPVT